MLKTLGIWTSLGLLLGLKGYIDHLDSAGAEASILLVLGLTFGVLGGILFVGIQRMQVQGQAHAVLQSTLAGTGSASIFIILNAAEAVIAPPPVGGGGSDVVLCGVLLIVGGVAGAMSGLVARAQQPALGTSRAGDVRDAK